MITSINFNFLQEHDPIFLQLASSAERNFTTDPNTTLVKVRQLGEALAQDIATRVGVAFDKDIKQIELINLLNKEGIFGKSATDAFHFIRKAGNEATHSFSSDKDTALKCLKMTHSLFAMYHSAFDNNFTAPTLSHPPSLSMMMSLAS